MTTWSPYEELGIEPNATEAEIKHAYRQAAKVAHPDQGGNEAAWANVALAYAILTNKAKRAIFDATGKVEEPKPDAVRPAALSMIAQLLEEHVNQFVDGDFAPQLDPEKLDLPRLMMARLRADAAEHAKQIAKGEGAVRSIRGVIKRMSLKGAGHDSVAEVLRAFLARTEERLEAFKQAREIREAAIDILAEYGYDFERIAKLTNSAAGDLSKTYFFIGT